MSDIALAVNALRGVGWEACGVRGREFAERDVSELARLGLDDPVFAWEREVMPEAYFQGLIRHRMGHYASYGFGVHGIWLNDRLVGQCGLQVLSETRDEVEFAIFLAKNVKHRGLGTCLARYLVERCVFVGMKDLYAVVRAENEEGMGMVRNLGGETVGPALHFGQAATVFRIGLERKS